MKPPVYQEALDAFATPPHEFTVEPVNSGLINQSYKVTSRTNGLAFLLQRINDQVFRNPIQVQLNYEMLWKYLQDEGIPFTIPEPKYFVDDVPFYSDREQHYWRVFEFMSGTSTIRVAENTHQAKEVAITFAKFTSSFRNFDPARLYITIPDFHNLAFRFRQFNTALHTRNYDRLSKASPLVEELKKRERYVNFYEVLIESEEFPRRVMHHDAKISNVLFDEETGQVVCPVDFDTVMGGYFFSDLGDMIRSMACSQDENSTAFDELTIRPDYYQAIIEGYISIMGTQFTPSEKKYIHFAGLIMFYMQALRFLSDYLSGDTYYRISTPDQNFDRTKNQLLLLEKLEEYLLTTYQFKV